MLLVKVQHVNKVILCYGNLREEEIEEGVCRISTILEVEIISF
jgi:DNA-binding transcriptional MocR family regulator